VPAPNDNVVTTTTFTANGTVRGGALYIYIDNRGGGDCTFTDQDDTNNIITVRANTVLNLERTSKQYPEYALVVNGATVDVTIAR